MVIVKFLLHIQFTYIYYIFVYKFHILHILKNLLNGALKDIIEKNSCPLPALVREENDSGIAGI